MDVTEGLNAPNPLPTDVPPIAIEVAEASMVGTARRAALEAARKAGAGEHLAGRLGLVVTEVATNLARHAREGALVVQVFPRSGGEPGFEVLGVDRGPGIADVGRAIEDGFSSAGGAGTGLGAISRTADAFDVDSYLAIGTVVFARVLAGPARSHQVAPPLMTGGISLPAVGQTARGDQWESMTSGPRTYLMVADGLGHGEEAAAAARAAGQSFRQATTATPDEHLELMHEALRGTRGAAVAIAEVDADEQVVRFAGVGNVAAYVVGPGATRGAASHPGIVGHQMRKVQTFEYPWSTNDVLVMASDGLKTQWQFDRYPGLLRRHPAVIAGTLWRDYSRRRDDATVVAVRELASWRSGVPATASERLSS